MKCGKRKDAIAQKIIILIDKKHFLNIMDREILN